MFLFILFFLPIARLARRRLYMAGGDSPVESELHRVKTGFQALSTTRPAVLYSVAKIWCVWNTQQKNTLELYVRLRCRSTERAARCSYLVSYY